MDYIPFSSMPYYSDCEPLVSSLGYELLELKTRNVRAALQVSVTLAPKEAGGVIGTVDCAKVHRILTPRLEALTGKTDIAMEVMSPGLERTIRNAAEFPLFLGRGIRVWDMEARDWVAGKLTAVMADALTLRVPSAEGAESDGEFTIPYTQIAKAKLGPA